ncbi:DUF6344 domain-containing protein [Streptomyces bambusae]|uniref:DUF6344 domain-containing protein n=1 Tax=Streptomyces bambusae TaxID=1550616 RepID=UPI001CFC544E|nr:DUF6344 domain-containing protein [Streptomyces bambusae]MCB5168922.1 DUF6344 domain-containing protein [Streptomyces bambusae]
MAASNRFASLWTVFLTVLAGILGVFGIRTAQAEFTVEGGRAHVTEVAAPEATEAAETAEAGTGAPAGVVRRRSGLVGGGALPPTIAQRIRAEAHGSSPSVRRSTTAAASMRRLSAADRDRRDRELDLAA